MSTTEKATFAAGCFWGVQEVFDALNGVLKTEVGYMGGTKPEPTYEQVCGGGTGHAEAVQITYDPSQISYEQLLKTFWENHNPTTPDRQGPDIGSQYRSVIFYHTEAQRKAAEKSKEELANSGQWKDPIVTHIVPADTFWRAEEYHQKYFEKTKG